MMSRVVVFRVINRVAWWADVRGIKKKSCFQLQYKLQRPQCLHYQVVTNLCCCERNITVEIVHYVRTSTRFKKHQIVISFETGFHIKLHLYELRNLTVSHYTKVEQSRLLLADSKYVTMDNTIFISLHHI